VTRVLYVGACLAAVASKETAAVAVGFVLADAWARRAHSRPLLLDTGIVAAIVGTFSVARLAAAFPAGSVPPITKYVLQRALFGTFGALAAPWHIDVVRRFPWLPIVGVLMILYLATCLFVAAGSRQRTRLAMTAAAWTLLPIVPVFPILFVAPDLEQSRYLYMPGVGWAALIAIAASEQVRAHLRPVSLAAAGAWIAIASYGTMLHLMPWREAAALRDRVEAAATASGMGACRTITLSNLPDSVRGAYVFRNGGAEAFARDLHISARIDTDAAGECAFRWRASGQSFVHHEP
jgi:hypothetical protein